MDIVQLLSLKARIEKIKKYKNCNKYYRDIAHICGGTFVNLTTLSPEQLSVIDQYVTNVEYKQYRHKLKSLSS